MLSRVKKSVLLAMKRWLHFFYAWYGAVKYRHPSEEMLVIGITGTTGKSSTVHFLRQLLESAGYRVGSLSTVDFCVAGKQELNDRKMTMLGKMEIQRYLRQMADAGCDIALIEVTSEGYLQHRHRYINFDTIVLTDLYPEHLERHGGFENYKKAKLGIFEYVASCRRKVLTAQKATGKTCVVNGNNQYAAEFLKHDFDKKIVFGREDSPMISDCGFGSHRILAGADSGLFLNLVASMCIVDNKGLHFFVGGTDFDAPLYGEYNIHNLLVAISVARSLDISWSVIQKAVNSVKPVPGRIEFIKEAEPRGFTVIVDYAYEPNALRGLYQTIELLKPGRVIHVCGSTGGGRDKSRRVPIGRIAGEKADIVIVTDEDPYDEDPMEIIKQVSAGAQAAGKVLGDNLFEILDRKEAVEMAVKLARTDDLVLVTGKGSEQAMCVAEGKMVPWDDRRVVRQALTNKY